VPGSLLTVAGAIAAVNVFGLDVPTVGSIASGLPSLGLPDIDLADAGRLAGGAVGVMLIAFAEGLGAAKAYAGRGGPRVDANRELLALGGANLASGMSSGMVVSGSLSKTAVNASAGARSQATGRPGLTSPSSAARPDPAARTTTSSDIATPAPRTRWLS
jgi:MFS superfamily sulfate permease-like transporter